jgi:hypothetical protein
VSSHTAPEGGRKGFRGWWIQQPRLGKIAFVGSIAFIPVLLVLGAAANTSHHSSDRNVPTATTSLTDGSTCTDWGNASSSDQANYADTRTDLDASEAATGGTKLQMIQSYCDIHSATGQGSDYLGDITSDSPL